MSNRVQLIRWVLYNSESKLQSIPVNHEEIQWTVMRMKQIDWKKYYIWRDGWQNWQPLDTYLRSNQKEIIVEFGNPDGIDDAADLDTQTETTATVKVERFSVEETPDKTTLSQSGVSHPGSAAHDAVKEADSELRQSGVKDLKKLKLNEIKPKSGKSVVEMAKPASKNTTFVDWEDQLAKLFVEGAQDYQGDEVSNESGKDSTRNPVSFKEEQLATKEYKNRAERHLLKIEVLFINTKGKTFKSFSRNISMSGTLIDHDIPHGFLEPKFEIIIINRFAKTTQNSRLQLFAKCPIPSAPNRIQFLDVKNNQKDKLKALLEQYLIDQKQMTSQAS